MLVGIREVEATTMNIKAITFTFFGIIVACGGSGLSNIGDAQAGEDGGACTCQGQQGPQGPAGAQGQQGVQGPPGTQGMAGTNGTNGTDGAQGAQGPQGIQGVQGATGAAGANGYPSSKTDLYVVTSNVTVPAGSSASTTAVCSAAKDILLSGSCSGSNAFLNAIAESYPENVSTTSTAADWYCSAGNPSSSAFTMTARAVCVTVP
jgi:hypothetical protein